ncbi:MAG: DUF29 domain-containing protein [Crocosphaera sp.]
MFCIFFLGILRQTITIRLIKSNRKRIRDSFENSPSLKVYFADNFDLCYQDARELAAAETGLSINEFPIESPFCQQDTLKPDYFPE